MPSFLYQQQPQTWNQGKDYFKIIKRKIIYLFIYYFIYLNTHAITIFPSSNTLATYSTIEQ